MKPMLYFIHTDGQILGSCAVKVFQDVWGKWSYIIITAVSHDLMLLSQVSNKHCTTRNKHHNRLDMNKTGETPYDLSRPTCNLLWKSLPINTIAGLVSVGTSFTVWASSCNPLLGRTRSRGKYWTAIPLSHRPEPSGHTVHGEVDGWTLEDNMVDGLFFCAKLTGLRGGHTPFV